MLNLDYAPVEDRILPYNIGQVEQGAPGAATSGIPDRIADPTVPGGPADMTLPLPPPPPDPGPGPQPAPGRPSYRVVYDYANGMWIPDPSDPAAADALAALLASGVLKQTPSFTPPASPATNPVAVSALQAVQQSGVLTPSPTPAPTNTTTMPAPSPSSTPQPSSGISGKTLLLGGGAVAALLFFFSGKHK